MQIAILGPLAVRDAAGAEIAVAGGRVRSVLARLALDAGRPVRTSTLVDAVWGERPPADTANALQTLVSRLRRALGDPAVIVQSAAGYRLDVARDDVDSHRFQRLATEGSDALRRGDLDEARDTLMTALALWRGAALTDLVGDNDAFHAEAARLTDLHVAALIDRLEVDLQTGRGAAVIAELETLVDAHPMHERLAAQLLRALAAGGRSAEALHMFERVRERLADELGADPGQELQDVHLALLRGELAATNNADADVPHLRRTNLKSQLTSFVGRDDEVARIGKSLELNRLVTLVGPGGAGKTRLASESAAHVVDTAPDGVWLIELAPVTSPSDVPQAILSALGLREVHMLDSRRKLSPRDAQSRLLDALRDKRILLVLDNCEHLIEACARQADLLLAECPGLRVLATSREPLGIFGEALLAVPPLGQPETSASAAEALEYPAVRLFDDRAGAVNPDFAVDDTAVAAVIEIVRRLDGLPLAIELAAARLRTMPITDIAARLSDRFRLLTGGSRTALPRHRTLRAVVEWSWELLSPDEAVLVEQLAVFPAGITASSAASVAELDELDAADSLASLADKSLLQPLNGGRRFRMLETIREFGIERLGERGDLAAVRKRHADHFAALLAQAEPHLTRGDQLPWFALLSEEQDNFLAALRFRCDIGDADGALRVANTLSLHAMLLGNHSDIAAWMADPLALPGWTDEPERLIAEAVFAVNSAAAGDADERVDPGSPQLRDLAYRLGDVDIAARPMTGMMRAAIAYFADEFELAERYMADAIEVGDEWAAAAAHMLRASLAENEGDVATIRRETTIALSAFRRLGERWGLSSSLRGAAQLHTLDGELDAAVETYLEALALATELGSRDDEGFLLGRLADVELRRGNAEQARRYVMQAQETTDARGSVMESMFVLTQLGGIEKEVGNLEEARRLLGIATAQLAGMPREHPAMGHMHAMLQTISARLAWEDGNADAALQFGRDSFEIALGTKDMPVVAVVGVTLADNTTRNGDPREGAVQLGASAALRGADDATALDVRRLTALLRAELGDQDFERLYAAGKALDRESAIERLRPS